MARRVRVTPLLVSSLLVVVMIVAAAALNLSGASDITDEETAGHPQPASAEH